MERRTKQNELTEVKLKKATSLLQKGVEDTGLSEILVNSEVHEKGTHSAIQEELTTGELKKEVEDQKLKIEEQSVTIKNRGILLKQSQEEMKKLKRRLESVEQMISMDGNPVMRRTFEENSNQRISSLPSLVRKAEQPIESRVVQPVGTEESRDQSFRGQMSRRFPGMKNLRFPGEELMEQSLRSDKTLRSKLFLKQVNPKAKSTKNH